VTWNNPDPSELIVKISPRVWLSLSHRRNKIFPIEAVPFEAVKMAADAVGATDPAAVPTPPNMPSSVPSAAIIPIRLMGTSLGRFLGSAESADRGCLAAETEIGPYSSGLSAEVMALSPGQAGAVRMDLVQGLQAAVFEPEND
jgi:hypothetical protein